MPHPSAPNAYPKANNSRPSGPDGPPTLTIVDVATGSSRVGAPTVTLARFVAGAYPSRFYPSQTTPSAPVVVYPGDVSTGSRTRTAADTLVVDRATADPAATGSRTSATGETIMRGDVATGSRTAGPLEALAIARMLVDPGASTSRTGTTPDVAARAVVDPTAAGSLTGDLAEQPLGNPVTVTDPTVGVAGITGATVDNYGVGTLAFDPAATGSRGGAPADTLTIVWGVNDVATGSGTGSPLFSLLFSVAVADAPSPSRTGHPTGETVGLGLPAVRINDPSASSSRTGLPAGDAASWPVTPGPPLTSIWTYHFPADPGLFPGPDVYPGLSVLFGRLTPRTVLTPTKAPTYRLYVADTVTGRVGYQVPFSSVAWSSPLNSLGTFSATLQVDKVIDALSDQDERDPKVLLGQFLSGSMRYTLALAYGHQVVWAGPYTPGSIPYSGAAVTVAAAEFGTMLGKRLLVTPVATQAALNTPAADVVFTNTTKPGLALQLMQAATGGDPSRALPWFCPDPPSTNGDVSRTYFGYDATPVWTAMSDLALEVDGPDIRFDPQLDWRADGLYLSYAMRIGTPLLRTETPWAWDSPNHAEVQWDVNVQNMATAYLGTGSGQDRTKLMVTSTNPELVELGWPALEVVDGLHSSAVDIPTLQAYTDADMALYRGPAVKWTVRVSGSGDPLAGTFRVGDSFQLTIRDHLVIPDGTYTRRITSLAGDGSDWVTVGSSDDYTAQATSATGIQVITGS